MGCMHPHDAGARSAPTPGAHRRAGGRADRPERAHGMHRLEPGPLHARSRRRRPLHARPGRTRASRGVRSGTLAAATTLSLLAGVGAGAAAERWGSEVLSVVPWPVGGDAARTGGAPAPGPAREGGGAVARGGALERGAVTGPVSEVAAVGPVVAGRESVQPDRGAPAPPVPLPAAAERLEPSREAEAPPEGLTEHDVTAGVLSREVPTAGSGELVVVPGSSPPPVEGVPVRTVRVEVERELAVDGEAFAAMVMATLNDARGWGADGSVGFARTDGEAELRVVLATPATVDAMCAPLTTVGTYSCGRNGHAALNAHRWWWATEEYARLVGGPGTAVDAPVDRTAYRQYLVNHEVGHLLGHAHVDCPAPGAPAPVMQQQTVQVGPCVPNAWPFPDAG